jgi:hypothetical protein
MRSLKDKDKKIFEIGCGSVRVWCGLVLLPDPRSGWLGFGYLKIIRSGPVGNGKVRCGTDFENLRYGTARFGMMWRGVETLKILRFGGVRFNLGSVRFVSVW